MASLKSGAYDCSGGRGCHVILNVIGVCRSAGILPSPASLPLNFIKKPTNHMIRGDGRVSYGTRLGHYYRPSALSLFSSILPRHSIQKGPRKRMLQQQSECPERSTLVDRIAALKGSLGLRLLSMSQRTP
jgi:hypothetical protein